MRQRLDGPTVGQGQQRLKETFDVGLLDKAMLDSPEMLTLEWMQGPTGLPLCAMEPCRTSNAVHFRPRSIQVRPQSAPRRAPPAYYPFFSHAPLTLQHHAWAPLSNEVLHVERTRVDSSPDPEWPASSSFFHVHPIRAVARTRAEKRRAEAPFLRNPRDDACQAKTID